jgi:hypothetical protein
MTLVYTSSNGPTQTQVELASGGLSRSATIRELTTDDIENDSSVSGATLTDALDSLAGSGAATGSAPGYLFRLFFTTPTLGTLVWNVPTDVPPCNEIELVAWSGGGAGANARFQQVAGTSNGGTAAAGGGARIAKRFSRAFIISQLPVSIIVGDFAIPPARPTVENTPQISTPGTLSAWIGASGPLVTAYGGGPGQALNLGSGGGGAPVNTTAVVGSSQPGGRGGSCGPRTDAATSGTGALGGVAGNPGGNGANGADAPANDVGYERSGEGGGGGGSSPIVGTVGGNGGNGGSPSGGGGSGAPGRGANGIAWGGAGGIGARGQCACTGYL